MPKTCENWLGLVKSCVYYAHQTRGIYQLLSYSVDFKGSFQMQWIRQNLINEGFFFLINEPVNIWNNSKAQKWSVFPNFWHCEIRISDSHVPGVNNTCIATALSKGTFHWRYFACNSNPMKTWWRHQMKTFSALLALCVGNSPVTGEFPSRRQVTRSFDVFFDLRLE